MTSYTYITNIINASKGGIICKIITITDMLQHHIIQIIDVVAVTIVLVIRAVYLVLDHKVQLVRKVPEDYKVQLVHKVQGDCKVHKVHKELLVIQVQ